MKKKIKISLLLLAILSTASSTLPAVLYAAPVSSSSAEHQLNQPAAQEPIQKDVGQTASISILAADYHISETDVHELLQNGWSYEDLNRAAFLALASGQSLKTIAGYKQIAENWTGVESLAGLTEWHIQEAQKNLIANQLYHSFAADPLAVKSLLAQKYHPKAVALAASLASAQNSSTGDIEIIMSKKNYGVSWEAVGEQIGLTPVQVQDRFQALNEIFSNRSKFGDAYGNYGGPYGYQDKAYHKDGYDIEAGAF